MKKFRERAAAITYVQKPVITAHFKKVKKVFAFLDAKYAAIPK